MFQLNLLSTPESHFVCSQLWTDSQVEHRRHFPFSNNDRKYFPCWPEHEFRNRSSYFVGRSRRYTSVHRDNANQLSGSDRFCPLLFRSSVFVSRSWRTSHPRANKPTSSNELHLHWMMYDCSQEKRWVSFRRALADAAERDISFQLHQALTFSTVAQLTVPRTGAAWSLWRILHIRDTDRRTR